MKKRKITTNIASLDRFTKLQEDAIRGGANIKWSGSISAGIKGPVGGGGGSTGDAKIEFKIGNG